MTSVVRVELCPARRAISSTGTPRWLIMLTNDVRSSFGTHLSPMPAPLQTLRKSRRTLWESSGVPTLVTNTRSFSSHRGPAASRSRACLARCSRSASMASCGNFSVRRDFSVFTSPCARTDRHTATVPASTSTCPHLSARASSERTPVSRQSTMNACRRDLAEAARRAVACSAFGDCDGRPGWPFGVSPSAETFLRTRSCASACRITRVRQLWAFCMVRVEYRAAIFLSADRTSCAVSSVSRTEPRSASRGLRASRLVSTVLAVRPGRPSASQSATAFSTVWPCRVRIPASRSAWRSLSLSRTSVLVLPLTFLRVASGIRCKSASAGSDFMGRLCGGSDSFWLIIGLGRCDGAWPQLTGWFEQRAAQVLQEPQAIWGHGQAAPAAGGPVEHGPDQGEAAGLAGQPADDLDPAAGLAEGSLDEVGMPDALVVVRREPQVGGQALLVGEQDLGRGWVDRLVAGGEFTDAGIDEFHQPGPGRGGEVFGVEDLPVGVLDLGLHPGRDLGQQVPASMDQTALTQRRGVNLLDRADQAGGAVADDQQRAGQAAVAQVGEEVLPGVERVAGSRRQADEGGLAVGGDAPGGQHRLGRGAGVHPEEAGVQEQVVHHDAVQAPPCPRLVLVLDLAADARHGGLGDRGLVAERLGQGRLHVADRQAADERGDHQALQRVCLGDVGAEQPGRERLTGAPQLRPGQGHGPRGGLDGHLPVPVTGAGPGILGARGPGVAVPAKKLSDLRFEGSLHQQLSAEPGHLLQDLRQRPVRGEQLIDVVADTVSRRYSDRHGRGSFLRRLAGLEGNLRPLLIYTGSWTPPSREKSCAGRVSVAGPSW